MRLLQNLSFFTNFPAYCILLQFFVCSSTTAKSIIHNHPEQFSHQTITDITLHGLLLWLSMGFLMPLGLLTIRMSNNKEVGRRRVKVLFYLHVIFQMLSVLIATVGAVMSIRKFENSFNNHHQRLGLVLYCAIWLQVSIGILRPRRGNKRRTTWYFLHWVLGTAITVMGIFNIYSGLKAYHKKTSKGIGLWTLLFTVEVFLIAFFYLFQDKWDYIQKQGESLGTEGITPPDQPISQTQMENQKVLVPMPSRKHNALKNLFD